MEKAQIGVIVFNPTDGGGDDFKQLAENIWMVKPRYVSMLATLLREGIVKVFAANRAAEGKDVKVELIYNYLTGGEFELVPSGVEFEEGGTKKKGDNTVRICYSIADNTRKQIGRNCHHEYSIPQEFRERQGSNWVN